MIRSALFSFLLTFALACSGSAGTGSGGDTTPGGNGGDNGTGADTGNGNGGGTAEPVREAPVFPDEPFRAELPKPSSPRPFQLPSVQTFKVGGNQVQVYLVERHELPTVSVEFNVEGGSMNDPRGKEGLASVCMGLLSEGTERLDKIAFNEALADIASSISSYAGSETQGVSMSTLSKHLDKTLDLYFETVLTPGFRAEELDRMVKRRIESLKQVKASPASVARRVADSILYGPKHVFGRIVTEASLKRITLADCRKYHSQYLKPRGGRLFIVGDMTTKQVKDVFEKRLAGWKGGPKKTRRPGRPQSRKGKFFFINIPGAAQSTIYVLHMGPTRKDPNYFANDMMASVLGGGFASRINMNLREDKGYSYGARGQFGYSRNFGEFVAASRVRADATYQSVVEIVGEMRDLKAGKKPAKADELEREKNGAILGMPAQFATARAALSRYRALVYYGLPLDYYNSYVDSVRAVKLEAVQAAAKRELRPDDALILVVGNGDAPQIHRNEEGQDTPLEVGGAQITLRQALTELTKSGRVGKGVIVELDGDGNVITGK